MEKETLTIKFIVYVHSRKEREREEKERRQCLSRKRVVCSHYTHEIASPTPTRACSWRVDERVIIVLVDSCVSLTDLSHSESCRRTRAAAAATGALRNARSHGCAASLGAE